jgi:hypothetical protein
VLPDPPLPVRLLVAMERIVLAVGRCANPKIFFTRVPPAFIASDERFASFDELFCRLPQNPDLVEREIAHCKQSWSDSYVIEQFAAVT